VSIKLVLTELQTGIDEYSYLYSYSYSFVLAFLLYAPFDPSL